MNTKSDTLKKEIYLKIEQTWIDKPKEVKKKPVFKFRFKTWEELKKYLAENARLYSK